MAEPVSEERRLARADEVTEIICTFLIEACWFEYLTDAFKEDLRALMRKRMIVAKRTDEEIAEFMKKKGIKALRWTATASIKDSTIGVEVKD
jgi:hypothetical protein